MSDPTPSSTSMPIYADRNSGENFADAKGMVNAYLARFAARGQPVYALRQASGAANLYFGAYESPQHAALAVPSVREAELTPTLAYRIGRVF